jgi:hypothetical protein
MMLAQPKTAGVASSLHRPLTRVAGTYAPGARRLPGRLGLATGVRSASAAGLSAAGLSAVGVSVAAEPTRRIEQVGACLMIAAFLVLALFG